MNKKGERLTTTLTAPAVVTLTAYVPDEFDPEHAMNCYYVLIEGPKNGMVTLAAPGYMIEPEPSFWGEDPRIRQPFKVSEKSIQGRINYTFYSAQWPWPKDAFQGLFSSAAIDAEFARIEALGHTDEERRAALTKEKEELSAAGLLP